MMRDRVILLAAVASAALASCGSSGDHHSARRLAAYKAPARESRAPALCGRPVHERLITRRRWLSRVAITEYYSTPEKLFTGKRVSAPGIPGRHPVDWLYSNRGIAMEGDGIGADGGHWHIDALGSGGWVNRAGHHTVPGRCPGHWSRGRPFWLEGGWRNRRGEVTVPLASGGWTNGRGVRKLSYKGVTFASGSSIPLHPYRTLAVDPRLIPRGSRVYIPYYRDHRLGNGWFVAQDTGGAIIGRHLDVYRPPPSSLSDGGRYLKGQRVYVVPPGG
jgi:3D (Asp-Asp-Asp) domain-containing protein